MVTFVEAKLHEDALVLTCLLQHTFTSKYVKGWSAVGLPKLSWLLEQVAVGVALVIKLQHSSSKLCCESAVAVAELQSQHFLASDMAWLVSVLSLGLLQQSCNDVHILWPVT